MRSYSTHNRRGSVLVTILWISLALVAVVLVLNREMLVEQMAAKNRVSMAQVSAAETGMEQYIIGVMAQELQYPGFMSTVQWQQRKIGDCYVWVIRPNADDETQPDYGLTDEASKWDLNGIAFTVLPLLPGLDQDITLSASILSWRSDPNTTVGAADLTTAQTNGGAVDNDYSSLNPPYFNKAAPFESTDELALLKGFTPDILWGYDTNHNGWVEPSEMQSNNQGASFQSATSSARGLMACVTVYGVRATNPPATQPSSGTTGGIVSGPGSQLQTINPVDATNGNSTIPADINNTAADTNSGRPALSTVLQQYLPAKATTLNNSATQGPTQAGGAAGGGGAGGRGGGGAGGAGGAAAAKWDSIWQWVNQNNLTSQDLTAIYPYVTCTVTPASTTTQNTNGTSTTTTAAQIAKINIMTAAKPVLMCLPGLTEQDVDAIIAQRDLISQDPANNDPTNLGWLLDVIPKNEFALNTINTGSMNTNPVTQTATTTTGGTTLPKLEQLITGKSTCYSADIVVLSSDGRAFKRVRIVVDAAMTPIQIIYRREITNVPFPLPAEIRTALQSGQPLDDTSSSGSRSARNNGLSQGIR